MNSRYYYPNQMNLRGTPQNDRGLLLPLLFGAAVGFPFGYIASNTNKNNGYPYPYPPMQMPPYYPNPYGYMQQSPIFYR